MKKLKFDSAMLNDGQGFKEIYLAKVTRNFAEGMRSVWLKYFQITSLSGDLMRTLELIHDDEYNIAAALLSDENPINSSVVQLVTFADTGSVLKQFDDCMSF